MSTRVHELAKELGLKSPELLERIQKWGLDVKASALASLDPPMVERIKGLMESPAAPPPPRPRRSPRPPRRACGRGRRRALEAGPPPHPFGDACH